MILIVLLAHWEKHDRHQSDEPCMLSCILNCLDWSLLVKAKGQVKIAVYVKNFGEDIAVSFFSRCPTPTHRFKYLRTNFNRVMTDIFCVI